MLIAMKPIFSQNHISNLESAIQNFFMSKGPWTKNQVPFEEGDFELFVEPYTHLLRKDLNQRVLLEEVFC